MNALRKYFVLVFLLVMPVSLLAQGTLADYERADNFRSIVQGLVYNTMDRANWIEESNRFWYRKAVKDGKEFILVDAETSTKQPAFDHERLAVSLSQAAGEQYSAKDLPFNTIAFINNGETIRFTVENVQWYCDLNSYECTKGEREERPTPQQRGRERQPRVQPSEWVSPDSTWTAYIQNYDLFIRSNDNGETFPLSHEGSEGDYYSTSISWSPDSKKIAVYRTRPGYERLVHYVESSPEDQLQPKHSTRVYAKPGDVLTLNTPVLFHVDTKKQIHITNELFPNPYSNGRIKWGEDSRAFTFEYNQRGHQVYRVIEVDANTGTARALINEECETFFEYSGKKYRNDIADGKEIIWMSERDGWNHLYLYDGTTGRVKNRITKGNWIVRNVDRVDVDNRRIYFRASGMYEGKDPYFINYYRINFDGTGLTAFTGGDGNHSISYSRDRIFYTDTYSRVDMPPVSELRRSSDGKLLMELERADITDLLKTGWTMPEVFVAKGRDGVTDIWGVICRPMNFDASKKYAVIENIYAGPQGSFVPKTFSANNSMQVLAELGFIVVQMDGMGTSNRSKAFHDVCWKNLGDAGFPDRILWHKAAAAKYPYMDITRVGIYGTSAGGQNSTGAVFFHPEFYKVAVSSCGCHDNRMDKIWWNELWMSYPIGPHYAESSNVDNAYRLQGKLLLIVGEMDTNVDPASTMQVVNALIKANKDFDLLIVPGMGHSGGGSYGERRRRDFFVRHLLGVEPPDWNTMVK